MDVEILLMINQGWSHPFGDLFFYWISQRASFTLPLLLIILTLLWRGHGSNGLKLWGLLLLFILLGDLVGNILKDLFSHPRPCAVLFEIIKQPHKTTGISCGAMTTGMPSNHTLNFFLTAVFLGVILRSWYWALPLLFIATLVAISRIYLGAHLPSQVLAGFILGITFGYGAALFSIKQLKFIKAIRSGQKSIQPDTGL